VDIKTKLLVSKFKNVSYFGNLESYILERVNENKLDYNKLKYLYDNLYNGYSEFIKQNIYPVGEFLSEGYSFEECEKLTDLLEDATGKTVFCYDKKEQGYRFNKLFADLKYSFDRYDEFIKSGCSKDIAFEKTKEESSSTPRMLKNYIVILEDGKYLYNSEMQDCFQYLTEEMKKLENDFKNSTSKDTKLQKYFENDIPSDRYKNIRIAGAILGGIDLRNLQRENNNLDGEIEEYPYSEEQIKMIDLYTKFENTMKKAEEYMSKNCEQEDDMEM